MKRLFALALTLPALAYAADAFAQYHVAVGDATTLKIPVQAIASSDHLTEKTDVSALTCKKSVNGGATASCSGSSAEVDDTDQPGTWAYTLHANDVSAAGVLVMRFSATGMDPYRATVQVGNLAANLKAIDEQATSTNSATLKLKQLDVTNSAGSAVIMASTGSNGVGLAVSGNGTGAGSTFTGGTPASGAGGNALTLTGGAGASTGIGGHGLSAAGGNGAGGNSAAGAGLNLAAGTPAGSGAAYGLFAFSNGGTGARLESGSTTGLRIAGAGGISVTGTTTPAFALSNTSGDVVTVTAAAGNGDAIQLTPQGTGVGINGTLATVNSVATGGIVAGSFAAGAVDAAAIAAGAIGASELATDAIGGDELAASAVTKIGAGVTGGSGGGQRIE